MNSRQQQMKEEEEEEEKKNKKKKTEKQKQTNKRTANCSSRSSIDSEQNSPPSTPWPKDLMSLISFKLELERSLAKGGKERKRQRDNRLFNTITNCLFNKKKLKSANTCILDCFKRVNSFISLLALALILTNCKKQQTTG
jgi:hypothetical protein